MKEAVVAKFEVYFGQFPGRTAKPKQTQMEYMVSRPRFDPGIQRIWNKNVFPLDRDVYMDPYISYSATESLNLIWSRQITKVSYLISR
jgi:hypothetical protein